MSEHSTPAESISSAAPTRTADAKRDSSSREFAGCSVVVTGASSGIGRQVALTLARRGAGSVVVHYCRNKSGARETADRIHKLGSRPVLIRADLADPSGGESLCDDAFDRLGQVDAWINNAGVDVLTGVAAEMAFEDKLRQLIDVDVVGTILLSRRVASRLAAQPPRELAAEDTDGTIPVPPAMVMIGWDQAPRGMEGDAGQMFGPVKAAVMAFANSLAQQYAPRVRVNCVAPGWIQTSWGETTSEYWDRRAKTQSLMNRWGTPADVAAAVAFVAAPQNTFTTAATVEVGGGWNRRFDA